MLLRSFELVSPEFLEKYKSMDFADQPEELVIQQLSQLPVEDILNACQSDRRIARICSGPVLWRMKLQMDFPGVYIQIPNPKEKYLELINERAKKELQYDLHGIPWTIGNGIQDNLAHLPEMIGESYELQDISEIINRLQQPISGLHHLVIYYPMEYNYHHRVEYGTNKAIAPQQVLESIEQFYDQPYTQENANAVIITGGGSTDKFYSVPSGSRTVEALGDYVFFEGLRPYKEGFTLRLGS